MRHFSHIFSQPAHKKSNMPARGFRPPSPFFAAAAIRASCMQSPRRQPFSQAPLAKRAAIY